jgi:toxin FitB
MYMMEADTWPVPNSIHRACVVRTDDQPRIHRGMDRQVLPRFEGRILPLDTAIAQRAAALRVPNRRPERDAFIAATALVNHMTIVTRNAADYAPTGVEILNPWERAPD